jgi:hypothetical protein
MGHPSSSVARSWQMVRNRGDGVVTLCAATSKSISGRAKVL